MMHVRVPRFDGSLKSLSLAHIRNYLLLRVNRRVFDSFPAEEAVMIGRFPDLRPGVSGNICGRIAAHRASRVAQYLGQMEISVTEIDMEHPFCDQVLAGTEDRQSWEWSSSDKRSRRVTRPSSSDDFSQLQVLYLGPKYVGPSLLIGFTLSSMKNARTLSAIDVSFEADAS
ncbi:hypothetical protein BJY00DRAFT_291319 [Aspergillus carlsbadensis]|nr:hypothetical protein BJY00DRAFT_291319 [Aspergillus carlsbadensis]